MLSKLKIFAILFAMMSIAHAEEYKMVVPYAPGSQADTATRVIIKNFEKITGDKILIELLPGADSIIGINHFKNSRADLIFLGSGASIYAPVVNKNLPYNPDTDFDRILYVGTAPAIWLSRPGTKVKTINDLATNMPAFVGTYASHGVSNIIIANHILGTKAEVTMFKGSPDVVLAVANSTIDLGVTNPTPGMIEMAKAGKLAVVGSTYHEDITIDSVAIPSVSKRIKLPQFNGSTEIAARPGMDPAKLEKLRQGLWAAVRDPETQEKLRSLFIMPDATINQQWINQYTKDVRERFLKYSKWTFPQTK